MSETVDRLTEDVQPRKVEESPEPNPAVDRIFRSYGGDPRTCSNWHAIALSFLEVAIYAVAPKVNDD